MADLDGFLGELGQEMRAVADYWQIDLGIIVALNFAYELRRVLTINCMLQENFQAQLQSDHNE